MHEINDSELLKNTINASNQLYIIDFYAVWCIPCSKFLPEFTRLEEKYTDVHFIKTNVDKADFVEEYNIEKVPTLVFIKNGKELCRTMNTLTTEIENIIIQNK